MAKDPRPALEDILRSIEWIEQDTRGATFESFARDRHTRQLVERNVEIISEASRRIPEEAKSKYLEIPWRAIAGVGNVLRHDYEEVAPKVLWDVVREDLRTLKRAVQKMLDEAQTARRRR